MNRFNYVDCIGSGFKRIENLIKRKNMLGEKGLTIQLENIKFLVTVEIKP